METLILKAKTKNGRTITIKNGKKVFAKIQDRKYWHKAFPKVGFNNSPRYAVEDGGLIWQYDNFSQAQAKILQLADQWYNGFGGAIGCEEVEIIIDWGNLVSKEERKRLLLPKKEQMQIVFEEFYDLEKQGFFD